MRWRPLRRSIYHSFIGRCEVIWSRREQPDGAAEAFGYYVSGDYQLARRWFTGARYDRSERAARCGAARYGGSRSLLTYWPSEFSQVRGQYRRISFAEADRERVAVPVPVLHRCARGASVLEVGHESPRAQSSVGPSVHRGQLRKSDARAVAGARRWRLPRGAGRAQRRRRRPRISRRSRARSAAIASPSNRSRAATRIRTSSKRSRASSSSCRRPIC